MGYVIAQLIKLKDYITRYEWDTYRYPTQFIRLKKENWDKFYEAWINPVEQKEEQRPEDRPEAKSFFSKLKGKFKRESVISETVADEDAETLPVARTEMELKKQFLDNIFNFQMKWATSTVTHSSFAEQHYYQDPKLKYLMQRFPDTFLVMYYPIFMIKQAPIEADIIIITPIEIEIIHYLEYEEEAAIMATDERTWHIETADEPRKILNPIIGLKRTEKIVHSILAAEKIDFTIRKTVLSRTNHIIFHTEAYNTRLIGSMNYEEWFKQKRNLISPLKSTQIKVSEALLKHCQTTAVRRPGWEEGYNSEKQADMED